MHDRSSSSFFSLARLRGFSLLLVLLQPGVASAEPRPCLGYVPTTGEWAKPQRQDERNYGYFECPPGMALYSVFKNASKPKSGPYIGIDANCCPLPREDILSDTHTWQAQSCPQDHVATGGYFHRYDDSSELPIRCTKINTNRYRLDEPESGVFWGNAPSAAFPMQENKRMRVSDIPLAIRYGVIRYSESINYPGGCIGEPPASLLTAKHSKRCKGHMFSQLLYAGAPGDPAAGTPVVMFPPCSYLSDLFDPAATCSYDPVIEGLR